MRAPHYLVGIFGGLLLAGTTSALSFDKGELVKAAIIEKISRFIDWPQQPGTAFSLCVIGEHPQLPVLRTYYESTTIAERPVAIRVLKRDEALAGCQVVLLAQKDASDLANYRARAERDHVLLIAEGSELAKNGVHVAFYSDMNKLRLEVNRKALEASGLKASFRLLEVAKVVD